MAEDTRENASGSRQIRLIVPREYLVLPGAAVVVGTALGLVRGSRAASLRFLAENVHRPPTTVQGWYLYNKTKNYRMILSGLKAAGADSLRLATTAVAWVGVEDGMKRAGWSEASELGAGIGTAAIFALVYRLPRRATWRTLAAGIMVGASVKTLRWTRNYLQHARTDRTEDEISGDETPAAA